MKGLYLTLHYHHHNDCIRWTAVSMILMFHCLAVGRGMEEGRLSKITKHKSQVFQEKGKADPKQKNKKIKIKSLFGSPSSFKS